MISSIQSFTRSRFALFAPPPRYNVAQWAEAKREIARGSSAEPGKWRNDRLPYLKEIMESFTDPTVSDTVLMMGKQLGKSECLVNAILFVIDADPANVLVKYPTREKAREFSQKKLATAIRAMPCLRGKVRESRSRDSGNTIFSKLFSGGSLQMFGANSPASLRGSSCKWIIQDEIDSDKANSEGDPVDQADGRAENFHDAVFIKASTCTLKGVSRIAALYEKSDQRSWHCACPKCNHWQILKWAQVRWTWRKADGSMESDPEKAVYVCEGCQAELSDFERVRMVMRGKWVAKFPGRSRRGYAMSGLYRIMGKKSKAFKSYLHEFVARFLEAKDDEASLQFWTNTFLNEVWEPKISKIDMSETMRRAETYGPTLPKKVLLLTCQVDVQADRLEYEVDGWGLAEESWGIEHARFLGDPHKPDVWRALDGLLNKTWDHPLLGQLRPVICVIDSGGVAKGQGFNDPVYRFVRPRQPNEFGPGVYAVKGSSTPDAPLVSNRRPKKGICLKLIGTNIAKTTVHARLRLEDHGPRFMHYPVGFGFDEEYFAQLAGEGQRTIKKRGFTFIEWHKLRERNEALDLRAYALAAVEILNPDFAAISAKARANDKDPDPEDAEMPKAVLPARRPLPALTRPKIFRPRFRR